MSTISLQQQIAAVQRELRLRENAYARWIKVGKMTPETAEYEIAAMRAVLDTLRRVAQQQPFELQG